MTPPDSMGRLNSMHFDSVMFLLIYFFYGSLTHSKNTLIKKLIKKIHAWNALKMVKNASFEADEMPLIWSKMHRLKPRCQRSKGFIASTKFRKSFSATISRAGEVITEFAFPASLFPAGEGSAASAFPALGFSAGGGFLSGHEMTTSCNKMVQCLLRDLKIITNFGM